MTIYLVVDPLGISQAFTSFKEAKEKFETLKQNCKHVHQQDHSFSYRNLSSVIDDEQIEQFSARYKNHKGFWTPEIYSLQKINIQ